jgi:hypothetical protein
MREVQVAVQVRDLAHERFLTDRAKAVCGRNAIGDVSHRPSDPSGGMNDVSSPSPLAIPTVRSSPAHVEDVL